MLYLCSRNNSRDGGIGRHEGLKIPWPVMAVRVRVPLAALSIILLLLASCGSKSGYFKLEGRFLHLNQGQFYVYSPDGVIPGIDTINVSGGRFAYEIPCREFGTLMLVFPNFSEQPIFAEPGASVTIKGDASHLKEMTVEGTDANDDMNSFRKVIVNSTPGNMDENIENFIRENSESPVCPYILRNYLIAGSKPNIPKAVEMINLMPKDAVSGTLRVALEKISSTSVGRTLPKFSAKDIKGNTINNSSIAKDKKTVIYVWSSWNYQSQDVQRQLGRNKAKVNLIGINIDGSKEEMQKVMKRDSVTWTTICDEQMFNSPLVRNLGLYSIPGNIVVGNNGRIIGRNMKVKDLVKLF